MSPQAIAYIYVITCVLVLAAGQLMFKLVSERIDNLSGILLNPNALVIFMGALGLYGFSTLLWVLALRTIPLSKAYPFMAIGFLIVPIAAYFTFGESINRMQILGMLFVVGGLIIVSTN